MICRSIWFAFVEEPLATGLAQEARDNEARRLILRAFSSLGHLFSNISRHKYHDRKTIKNYVIGRSTSTHPEKIRMRMVQQRLRQPGAFALFQSRVNYTLTQDKP